MRYDDFYFVTKGLNVRNACEMWFNWLISQG